MENKTYNNIKITKLPKSEVEIEGEISAEEMGKARKASLKKLGEEASLPGFRKGHIPEDILVSKLGEMHILEEAAEIALQEAYPKIVIEHDISVIGRPRISITKIAKDNPLGFKIKVPVFPEVTLPDYKKIAKKVVEEKEEKIEVSDEEVETVVKQLQENKAGVNKISEEKDKEEKEKSLPPVDLEFVKSFGNFKDVEEFKAKIKENLFAEKLSRAKEKKRLTLGEKLVTETKIDLPDVLVYGEINKMHMQLEEDLKRMGLKIEDYLTHAKKTVDDLKKDWEKPAKEKATLQIILNKIAIDENLKASPEDIKKEVDHILEHHKDAERDRVESYVEMMLTNAKVFQFLESK